VWPALGIHPALQIWSADQSPWAVAAWFRESRILDDDPAIFTTRTSVELSAITKGIARGDESAFNCFYDTYCERIYRYLLVIAKGDEEVTRDCLQDTMVRVVRYAKVFDDEKKFWGWLTRVARTAFIDRQRKRKRDGIPVDPQFLELEHDSISVANDLEGLLQDALAELEGEERMIVERFYFEGRSHRDIASDLGVTSRAVESRLARIRDKLRSWILGATGNDR
jgi:RNA polymerase sigma-70 factor (ECF subfamily)